MKESGQIPEKGGYRLTGGGGGGEQSKEHGKARSGNSRRMGQAAKGLGHQLLSLNSLCRQWECRMCKYYTHAIIWAEGWTEQVRLDQTRSNQDIAKESYSNRI